MSDVFVFADDETVEPQVVTDEQESWKVLIVDDDESVHQVTRLALKRVVLDERPLEFISAYSGAQARQLIRQHDDVALVLLDIVMETDNAGFEVANYIRHELGNRMTRIILRTGQPGDVPERDVILNYEIDGYKTKSELTSQALFSVILTSLRSYRDLSRIEENNQRLDAVVETCADIFEQRTVETFVACLTGHLRGFIPVKSSVDESRYFAADFFSGRLGFLTGSDSFACVAGDDLFDHLCADVRSLVEEAQAQHRSVWRDGHLVLVGQSKSQRSLMLYFSDVKPLSDTLWHMLNIFCRNFETAFENLLLSLENENHRKNLETRVKERTAQLIDAKDRLFHAERLASIGQLAAGVAHEINNPLGFIKSNMSMVADSCDQLLALAEHYQQMRIEGDGEQLQKLQGLLETADLAYLQEEIPIVMYETNEGIDRIRRIAADLRDFASLEAGRLHDVDLNQLLDNRLQLLPEELTTGIEIRRCYADLPPLPLMQEQFAQALDNIITNAFEAMQGKGVFELSTEKLGEDVVISIKDSGCGISEDGLTRIFDPFYTTKDVGKGTGLGLSLSYGVIRFHGGEVEVTSQQGVGTAFRIRLPAQSCVSLEGI